MANCLVTKLKAEVNNPDLPVFETMQQFTLDAIAASGNATMTDAQKLALNHFFYRIGAIDNNGIYAKLGGLFMPLICGDVLAKALVDYKGTNIEGREDISSKNAKFQHHGIVKSDPSQSASTANQIMRTNYAGSVTSLTVAAMFTESFLADSSSTLSLIGFKDSTDAAFKQISAAQSSTIDYMQLLAKRATYSPKTAFSGAIGTIDGNIHSALFISDSPFESTGTTDSGSAPTSVNYVQICWNNVAPIGIYAYGSALSSSERDVFARAMKDLVAAFVVD